MLNRIRQKCIAEMCSYWVSGRNKIEFKAVRSLLKPGLIAALLTGLAPAAIAINNNVELSRETPGDSRGQFIPYGFYNEDVGTAIAGVFMSKGIIQPQVLTVANAFYGSSGSYSLFYANTDIKLPWSERFFVDTVALFSDWNDIESYQDGNPDFTDQRAGSNSSDQDNFIDARGDDFFAWLNFKYLLPVGDGREDPPHNFGLTEGILVPSTAAGGRGWNPLKSGRTLFELRPFYRDQEFINIDDGDLAVNKTAGVKLSLEYDNTDWYNNPTTGTNQRLTWATDWGLLDDTATWTAIQGRHSQYWSLGESNKARQRVIAFDLWTSHSPSWNQTDIVDGEEVFSRPPLFEGSTLGGLERQRGYASYRFWDRSAINYSLEYRYIPRWNPLPSIPYVNQLYIPWWQWVGFVEAGRVNDEWDVSELHSDMKLTVGGGVRALVYELVVRADLGISEEGMELQMFFNQPF